MIVQVLNYIIYFMLFLQIAGIIFAVVIDPYINKKHRRVILINTLFTIILILQNYLETSFAEDLAMRNYRIITSVIGYSLRPFIIVMWIYLVRKNQKLIVAWSLALLNVLIHMTAFFSNICFTITKTNSFERGPLGYTCHVISFILMVYLFWLSADKYIDSASTRQQKNNEFTEFFANYRRGLEGFFPVWCIIMIILSVYFDSKIFVPRMPIAFLTAAIVSCNLFYYIWLHLGYVQEHEEDLEAKQRIQIMMSQIQPHFLYNTLSTIQALCMTEPEKAADISEKFGTYLRQNIDSLNQTDLIPFSKELEHTKVYADIEKVRFPSIEVNYNVKELGDGDFNIPALTIQPMVENAIRHGVRGKENGVIDVIVSKKPFGEKKKRFGEREEFYYEIIVKDNGKGFDTKELNDHEGQHIGIQNVRERIESMCGGTLSVNSKPGEGTTIYIRVPEDEVKII